MRIYSSVRSMFAQSQLLLIINTKLPFMPHHAYKQQPAKAAISSSRQSVHKLFRNVFVFGASFPFLTHCLCFCLQETRESLPFLTDCGRSNKTKKKNEKCEEAKRRKQNKFFYNSVSDLNAEHRAFLLFLFIYLFFHLLFNQENGQTGD